MTARFPLVKRVRTVVAIGVLLSLVMVQLFPAAAAATINSDSLGTAPGRFNAIRIADVDADGNLEIVTGNYEGFISVIEYKEGGYRQEWKSGILEYRLWGLDVGDVDNDGDLDIVVGGGHGHVYAFDGKSHRRLWESPVLVRDAHGIDIGDVNSDGKNELVVGCGYRTDVPHGRIYVFQWANHTELYKDAAIAQEFDAKIRGMAIADIDADGTKEIIAGSGVVLGEKPGEGYVRVFNGRDGSLEWKSPDTNGDVEGLVVADTDGDGNQEITGGNGYRYYNGFAFQYRFRGEAGVGSPQTYDQVWFSDNIGPKAYGLAVGDIDGDNTNEIVVGNQPGYIWVFDGSTKQVEWRSELLGSDVLGIALADLDRDGALEIVAGQGGYQGKADFTSAYTSPHIYVIDGKTKAVEAKLGEEDYLELGLQSATLLVVIILLAEVGFWAKKRRETLGRDIDGSAAGTASGGAGPGEGKDAA